MARGTYANGRRDAIIERLDEGFDGINESLTEIKAQLPTFATREDLNKLEKKFIECRTKHDTGEATVETEEEKKRKKRNLALVIIGVIATYLGLMASLTLGIINILKR